ncbi:5,10-methylenetetrahydrofolate reductase [Geothermobacter ehrlichii]|uniref:Methylenetetrahydrofolate reductase n=1 Tax=Geothermobacter ehrlichii TaxID=213224 RepID=A0A5D3WFF0_9BACT|nr:methylenetetrahydrofolate reductase [Geothermobacter ehrlichii]TYO96354.1 5,10-methylenetetrahydrofolate reductase [Geothermobacter ehrlichii]
MSRLADSLRTGDFVVTAEVAPPKGADPGRELDLAAAQTGVTAINVTDNQGANMRMSGMALAGLMVRRGVEPVLQLTCRDRNRIALQSDLLGAAALGVENLLLLSGDHARFGDHPDARPVFDLDSVQLLQAVRQLNAGSDMAGRPLSSAPRFFTGAAVAPATRPLELVYQKVVKKAEAGARFFQSQAVFDSDAVADFMTLVRPLGVPVILGVLLLKSASMARFLNRCIPGVRVPERLVELLDRAADPLAEGVAIARDMVGVAREHCQGVHLMLLGREDLMRQILF